jgi:hypothetical protein
MSTRGNNRDETEDAADKSRMEVRAGASVADESTASGQTSVDGTREYEEQALYWLGLPVSRVRKERGKVRDQYKVRWSRSRKVKRTIGVVVVLTTGAVIAIAQWAAGSGKESNLKPNPNPNSNPNSKPETGNRGSTPDPQRPTPVEDPVQQAAVKLESTLAETRRRVLGELLAGEDVRVLPDFETPEAGTITVGRYRGQPLFARSLLEPEEAVLRAKASSTSRPEWREFAKQKIDSLLRLEMTARDGAAQRALSAAGLVRDVQEQQTQEVKALIDVELERQAGESLTPDQKKALNDFVRSVQQDLEPKRAIYRLILAPTAKQAAVDRIANELQAGTPFEKVAELEENALHHIAGLQVRMLQPRGLADTVLFGNRKVNEVAAILSPGQYAGPIVWDEFQAWVCLESITVPQIQALNEIVPAHLPQRRSDVDVFSERLIVLAEEWFLK